MGLAYNTYINSNKIFGCKHCKTHLADGHDIISRVSCLISFLWNFLILVSITSTLFVRSVLTIMDAFAQQNFRGQHGKAYLFDNVVNINQSEAVERSMTTGRHVVRDIFCRQCKETVGWKYDKAYESSEKYKEGKFILEAELLCLVY